MARKVHEDIGPVGADLACHAFVRPAPEIAPHGRQRPEPLGNRIGPEMVVVEHDFELLPIEMSEYRLDK